MRNALLLFAVSLAWACEYLFISRGETGLRPLEISVVLIGSGALLLLLLVRGVFRRPLFPVLRKAPFVIGVMAVAAIILPTIGTTLAERRISPDLAALVGTTVPLATFFFVALMSRNSQLGLRHVIGGGLALGGILVFVGVGNLSQEVATFESIAIMMAGGLVFAFSNVFAANRTKDLDPLVLTTWMLVLGTFGLVAVTLVLHGVPQPVQDQSVLLWVVAGGLVSVGFAYLGYYVLIQRAGAVTASLYAYLVPVLAFLSNAAFAGEAITLSRVAGMVLVLAGLLLTVAERKIRPEKRVVAVHTAP